MYAQVLQIIAEDIETQTGVYIEKYLMIYTFEKHTVEFQLNSDTKRIPLDQPLLADGIKGYIEAAVDMQKFNIDYAIISFERNIPGKIGIHMTNKVTGEKVSETIAV